MARDLILIAISLFTWGLGESAFFSFQPLYLQQLGADPLRIGAILGGYGLAATLAQLAVVTERGDRDEIIAVLQAAIPGAAISEARTADITSVV